MGYRVFQKLCEDRGITPYKVAQDLGFSRGTFTDWKMGRSTPKMAKMTKVAEYFDYPIEYFYADDDTLDLEKHISMTADYTKEYNQMKDAIAYVVDDNDDGKRFYIEFDTAKMAEKIKDEYKMLFDACKDMNEEQIKQVARFAKFIIGDDGANERIDKYFDN